MILHVLMIAATSFAQPEPPVAKSGYCGDIKKISETIKVCEENEILVKLAALCTIRFDARAKQRGAELGNLLGAKGGNQSISQKENEANLAKTIGEIDKLMDGADVAYNDMNYFLLNMVQPADLDEMGSPAEQAKFAKEAKCFGPNRRMLRIARRGFRRRYLALAQAKEISSALSGQSRGFENSLRGTSSKMSPKTGLGSGAPDHGKPSNVGSGKSNGDQSTITGVKPKAP